MMRTNKLAQSTLEYILILTAVIAVILFAAANWMKPQQQRYLDNAQGAIGNAADKLDIATQ